MTAQRRALQSALQQCWNLLESSASIPRARVGQCTGSGLLCSKQRQGSITLLPPQTRVSRPALPAQSPPLQQPRLPIWPRANEQLRLFRTSAGLLDKTIAYPLAQTGEGISECELIQWFVKEGDTVKEFDKICEVQSDKASVEISSRFDAKVTKLHHKKGDIVKVGATLVDLQVSDDINLPPDMISHVVSGTQQTATHTQAPPPQPPTPQPSAAKHTATPAPKAAAPAAKVAAPAATAAAAAATAAAAGVLTSPAVRRLAREHNVDLSVVSGTGPNGRVLKEDVERYIASQQGTQDTPAPAAAPATPPTTAPTIAPLPPPATVLPDKVIPVKGYRRAMIKSMAAVANVPHFHLHDEVTVDALMSVRKALSSDPTLGGVKLTMLSFIVKVQRLSIAQIAGELTRLQQAAAANKLTTADITGGTFTLSNIGEATTAGGLKAPNSSPEDGKVLIQDGV